MKTLFWDTESTDLEASWGRILCSSFVTLLDEPYTFRGDKRPWKGKETIDDSKLAVATRNEIETADILVTWNGIRHDVSLLNARLALAGERAVKLGEKHGTWHVDAMYYVGETTLKIGGRKLDTAAKFFGLENQKTPLDGLVWQRASAGDKEAMNQIAVHCEYDVLVLRDLWPYLAPGIKKFSFTLSEVWPYVEHIPSRVRAS